MDSQSKQPWFVLTFWMNLNNSSKGNNNNNQQQPSIAIAIEVRVDEVAIEVRVFDQRIDERWWMAIRSIGSNAGPGFEERQEGRQQKTRLSVRRSSELSGLDGCSWLLHRRKLVKSEDLYLASYHATSSVKGTNSRGLRDLNLITMKDYREAS